MNTDDLKFNFGCASCGYKEPNERIDVRRVLSKLDTFFDANDLIGAGRLLDFWRREAERFGDLRGEFSMVSEQMGYYRKTGEKEKALESVERGFFLIDQIGISDHVSAATVYLNAATTMKAFGLADKALPYYEKTREIYGKNLREDDRLFAGFWNNYGLALFDVGQYDDAEAAFYKAIAIMEKTPGGNPDAAVSYINMAQLFGAMDDKTGEDILACYERAKILLESNDNVRNGYYYFVLSKCAPAFRDVGESDIADEMERQVKAFREGLGTGKKVL